jgi:hypothetical protein
MEMRTPSHTDAVEPAMSRWSEELRPRPEVTDLNLGGNVTTLWMLLLILCGIVLTRGLAPSEPPQFTPGKYCCKMSETGYVGCIVFKSDGSYDATAKFHDKAGTSRGTWKRVGNQIVLKPENETGSLIGYLARFSINDNTGKSLTWLPKIRQDFSRAGGALVYPRYEKSD